MVTATKTVSSLLQTVDPVEKAKQPVRLLACGSPEGVESIIHRLHIEGFAQVGEWSPPLPAPNQGEVIRVLTRYYGGVTEA